MAFRRGDRTFHLLFSEVAGRNRIPAGGEYPHVHALAPIRGRWVYPSLHFTAMLFHISRGKPARFYIPVLKAPLGLGFLLYLSSPAVSWDAVMVSIMHLPSLIPWDVWLCQWVPGVLTSFLPSLGMPRFRLPAPLEHQAASP